MNTPRIHTGLRLGLAAAALTAGAAAAQGQTNIGTTNKWCWEENVGFANWRDANAGAQGVRIFNSYMAGFIWAENVGWISAGDGAPAGSGPGGPQYTNTFSGTLDYGVNVDGPSGNLSGFAWGENIGWVNFSGGALATPAQPARIDYSSNRLRGYAWGENVGWFNLDDANIFVDYIPICRTDFNHDGAVTVADIFAMITGWFAHWPSADWNSSGLFEVSDIFGFISSWFVPC